jgi:uncharacterized protein YcaQ
MQALLRKYTQHGIPREIAIPLIAAGFSTLKLVKAATRDELLKVIDEKTLAQIDAALGVKRAEG